MTEQLTSIQEKVLPLSLKDSPSLIERLLPVQKISAEAQKERKAGPGQTLTGLGSYWKGRKPLFLNKACILGVLLPATDNVQKDLEVFEILMGVDDSSFKNRVKAIRDSESVVALSYLERMSVAYRPEEIPDEELYGGKWEYVNNHLGTSAHSFPELIEQLGVMRFGRRPKVADTFSGSGQIPFEAARLGCDVYASDLNPVACLLTWGGLNIIGAQPEPRKAIEEARRQLVQRIDEEVCELRIEHDSEGNRAKSYLYCLETRCPQTGWLVPMLPSLLVGRTDKVVARLVPNYDQRRFDIEIASQASDDEMLKAEVGTVQDECLVYVLDGEEYRTSMKTIRGDYKNTDKTWANRLRQWEKDDFGSRQDDVFRERLYAIHWIARETLNSKRQRTFFTGVREEDAAREQRVHALVQQNLSQWQTDGLVPDMRIESGYNTDQPIRTRGWTYWHHLFSPRQLFLLALFQKHSKFFDGREASANSLYLCAVLNFSSKLCRFDPSGGNIGRAPKINNVFDNQALNPLYNWGERACSYLFSDESTAKSYPFAHGIETKVSCFPASALPYHCDYFITDPPYADAIHYHEITEYFIAWLRKSPAGPFKDWIWDSRRALAIKGVGDQFRADMVAAYKAMADQMSDNGRQVIMFTHQDSGIWADMASIVWGAGLQVTAAWYIGTETSSELKKGGYVQGTVLLVLRKRVSNSLAYRDELVQEVKTEVVRQLDTLLGLNQTIKGAGRTENLFEDADLQMAGYAAALRVLTAYTHIDGQDMTAEALRPRERGQKGVVGEIIDFAVQVANEHLVPEGLPPAVWEKLTSSERFYLKMLDIEAAGLKKLDNYQNFAKAFRVANYTSLMASMKANASRLKTGLEFKKAEFDGEFGQSALRAALFALYEIQKEVDTDEVMNHLRDMVPGYHIRRDVLVAFAGYIAAKRASSDPKEAEAARILLGCIQNERLGG